MRVGSSGQLRASLHRREGAAPRESTGLLLVTRPRDPCRRLKTARAKYSSFVETTIINHRRKEPASPERKMAERREETSRVSFLHTIYSSHRSGRQEAHGRMQAVVEELVQKLPDSKPSFF